MTYSGTLLCFYRFISDILRSMAHLETHSKSHELALLTSVHAKRTNDTAVLKGNPALSTVTQAAVTFESTVKDYGGEDGEISLLLLGYSHQCS